MIAGPGWTTRVRRDYAARGYPEPTLADLGASVAAIRPGVLDFCFALGREAGVPAAVAEARTVAIAYSVAAVNLADDLADGDCDYLAEPFRSGPTTQYLLQCLFFEKVCALGTPAEVLAAVTRDFEQVAAWQHVEIVTKAWTGELARDVALGITARQVVAYLRIALFGRPPAEHAEALGLDVGLATHVALDAESSDSRFWSIAPRDRDELARSALDAIERAAAFEFEALEPIAAQVRRTLDPLVRPR